MRKPLEERFWAQVPRAQSDKCWEWKGARFGAPWDYGMITNGATSTGKPKRDGAHRVSWELHNGPIPEGGYICHHCDNPPCVNPTHLFLGTALDNLRDMMTKGRARNSKAEWTHCARGHEFTPENTMRRAGERGGKRRCRVCARQFHAEWRTKNPERYKELMRRNNRKKHQGRPRILA